MNVRALGLVLLAVIAVGLVACGDDDGGASAETVTKLIGPAGGTVELAGGGKVIIPAGALNETVSIKVTKLNLDDIAAVPNNLEASGKPYAFEPHGQNFAQAVKIEVPFDDGDATEVRPIKLDDEADTTWQTLVGSTKNVSQKKLSIDTTTFSVILAARPRRDSGVITLPDGATIPLDAGSDASSDAAAVDAGSDASVDASSDAMTSVDASSDAGVAVAPIQCDPMTPIDNNNFATYPIVAFTRPNGGYGVLWSVSSGAMGAIWDGTTWHPQTFAGADINPVVIAKDGQDNIYADWGTGRASLPVGANAFGNIDTTRTPAPYGAGHNIGLVGLPNGGALAVWSEVEMKSARATPSAWQTAITADARRRNEPDVAINASGDIAASWWTAGTNAGQADVTLALWNGSTWTLLPDHTIGAAIGGNVGSVRIAILSNGDPYLFYAQASSGDQSIHGVRYSVTGGTWGGDELLISSANTNYRHVIDGSDRITVVGVDPTTQRVQATRYISGVWSTPENLNIGQIASLRLNQNGDPVLLVIPPGQQSPTIAMVDRRETTWLAPSPTPFPVSNILSNMVDVAFDTTSDDMIVFSASYNGQMQSLQASICR